MKAVVGTMSLSLGVLVFVIGARSSHDASGEAFAYLSALAITVAALTYVTTVCRLMPGLIIVVLFGFAYAPGASDSMTRGVLNGQIPASAEGARMAIAATTLFLLSVVGFLLWWTRSRLAARAADHAVRIIGAGNGRAFSLGLAALFVITLIVGFRSGFWSYYGGDAADVKSGGLRLELLYESMLLSVFAVLGRHLGQTVWHVPFSTTSMLKRLLPWLALLILIFIHQSRRLMATALIITAIDPVLFVLKRGTHRDVPLIRIAAVGAAGLALVFALLVGSALWRTSFTSSGRIASNWDSQLQYTMGNMATRTLDADSAVAETAARFTYLWIDAVSIDQVNVLPSAGDLVDVFYSDVTTATPGILFPDKYKSPPIRCESVFGLAGVTNDLSCTPMSEIVLFGRGSLLAFAVVAALFALGLTVATLAHRQGSNAGLVLSCIMLQPFSIIETGAFPIVLALRSLIITGGFLALATWLLRFLVRSSHQTNVENLSDVP